MLAKSQLHELYYWLQLNRILDKRLEALYRNGSAPGFVHSSQGQEAISIGTCCALGPDDILVPALRNLGALLVRGMSPRELVAHHLGRSGTPTEGHESGLNVGDLRRGIIAPISIVSALIPVAAGIALAIKMKKQKSVVLSFVGDDGSNTTDFHEGLNFAAVHKLPMILVLESNGYSFSTPSEKHAANASFITRANAYGVAGVEVDGNDILAVYEATRQSVEDARKGAGPVFMVANTMRMGGFTASDSPFHTPETLFAEWMERDPIIRFEEFLAKNALICPLEMQSIMQRVRAEVDEATELADKSPFPAEGQIPGSFLPPCAMNSRTGT